MKKFSNYQYIGGEMTERDKQEVNSKFWNKGKWENYVLPHLPDDGKDQILVDMGCNAGLFLKLAKDKGFRAIGVDADKEAIEKASNAGYEVHHRRMERAIDKLPVADYTILVNAHYYFKIGDWLEYLDKLANKTRYCIIVTVKKSEVIYKASADLGHIRTYFKDWKETGFIDELPLNGLHARKMYSLCFKSKLERVPMDRLDCGNHVQDEFYAELDKGIQKTKYYKILRNYRKKWSKEKLIKFLEGKAKIYEDIKKNGLKNPLIINSRKRIVDGNHRYSMLKHLGYNSVIIRKVL